MGTLFDICIKKRLTPSMQCVKILFTGPECTGKSTWAAEVASSMAGFMVEEVARTYIAGLQNGYERADVIEIGRLQLEAESQAVTEHDVVVCDTSLLVISVWLSEKFGVSLWSEEFVSDHLRSFDHIFLCYPDIDWVDDGLRENPNDRDRLFAIYETWLVDHDISFEKLKGARLQRQQIVSQRLNINF